MKAPCAAVAVALALMMVGCASNSNRTAANTSSPPSSNTTPLAALEPGPQAAPRFWPPLTFTVPAGWFTEREAQGLVPLVPDTAENRARSIEGGYPVPFLYVLPNI